MYNSNIIFCCKRFFEQLFKDNVSYLFLQHIYYNCSRRTEYCRKRYLTTFAVKYNIFCAFFDDAATSDITIQESDIKSTLFSQSSANSFQLYSDSATPKSTTLLLLISAQASDTLTLAHKNLIEKFSKLIYSISV